MIQIKVIRVDTGWAEMSTFKIYSKDPLEDLILGEDYYKRKIGISQ